MKQIYCTLLVETDELTEMTEIIIASSIAKGGMHGCTSLYMGTAIEFQSMRGSGEEAEEAKTEDGFVFQGMDHWYLLVSSVGFVESFPPCPRGGLGPAYSAAETLLRGAGAGAGVSG